MFRVAVTDPKGAFCDPSPPTIVMTAVCRGRVDGIGKPFHHRALIELSLPRVEFEMTALGLRQWAAACLAVAEVIECEQKESGELE